MLRLGSTRGGGRRGGRGSGFRCWSSVAAIAVADQKACSFEEPGEAQIAGLLGDPAAVRVGRPAREPNPTAGLFDEEQHVVAAQEQRLDREKVARDDARGLGLQELAPARPRASRRGPSRARASRRRILVGDARTPSLASSPQILRCPQRGFSRASRNTSSRISGESRGRPSRAPGCRHFRRTSDWCQRRSVRGVLAPFRELS